MIAARARRRPSATFSNARVCVICKLSPLLGRTDLQSTCYFKIIEPLVSQLLWLTVLIITRIEVGKQHHPINPIVLSVTSIHVEPLARLLRIGHF